MKLAPSGLKRAMRGPSLLFLVAMSFWQGNESPNGPVLHIHLQGVLTNPNMRRGLVISRLEFFRLTPIGIFSKGECMNFTLDGEPSGIFQLTKVNPRHAALFEVHHLHRGNIRKQRVGFGAAYKSLINETVEQENCAASTRANASPSLIGARQKMAPRPRGPAAGDV